MRIRIKLNFDKLNRWADRVIERLEPTSPGPLQDALMASMDVYMTFIRARFALYSQRAGDWQEHAAKTIRKRGPGAPILYLTGQMFESLQRGQEYHILVFTERGITEGTSEFKAHIHQHGAVVVIDGETAEIPARRMFVPPEDQELEEMAAVLVAGLKLVLQIDSLAA